MKTLIGLIKLCAVIIMPQYIDFVCLSKNVLHLHKTKRHS